MPRIGRSNRYDGGASHTLLSITRRCRQNLKPATRTATNAGMSDIEEAVRAILKACAELSAAQAALDHKPDATTAPRDYAVTKVIEAFNRFAAGAQAARKATCDQDHSHPTIQLSRRGRRLNDDYEYARNPYKMALLDRRAMLCYVRRATAQKQRSG